MIIQEAFNASTLQWRRILFDLVAELRSALGSGSVNYRLTFLKVDQMLKANIALSGNTENSAIDVKEPEW